MVYQIEYKNPKHNWGQHTLGDYFPGLDEINRHIIDKFDEARYLLKKKRHLELKRNRISNLPPLRRGRKIKRYPSKSHFNMSIARDVAEVRKFPWFTRLWYQNRSSSKASNPASQQFLDDIVPNLYEIRKRKLPKKKNTKSPALSKQPRQSIPHFHSFPYLDKHHYCSFMANWAWCARSPGNDHAAQLCHIFYLNSFDFFDEPEYLREIGWSNRRFGLPSDLIRMELFRMLGGMDSITQFYGMLEMSYVPLNYIGVVMINQLPDAKHYSSRLRQIGAQRVKQYFAYLVSISREMGLIRDKIHTWDGQFYKTWLQKDKPRKTNLEQFFGGTYNHRNKNVGIGVYSSPIMDWNGYVELPLIIEAVPANENENKAVKRLIKKAYDTNQISRPKFFLADRGPSGRPVQQTLIDYKITPIIPLTSNVKYDIRLTENKKHRFYQTCLEEYTDLELERLYNIRTRHEEAYSLCDVVFRMTRIHFAGKEMTEFILYLSCCLMHLIAQTAYKIGRPDLMWSPAKFRDGKVSPSLIFPTQYDQILKMREDPSEYKSLNEINRLTKEQRFTEIKFGIN